MYGIEFSSNPDQMNNVIEYQVISSEDLSLENKVQILHNCTSCDAYFMDRDVLRRHIGLIHENKIPLECTYCYAVFIEHKKLTQHKVCMYLVLLWSRFACGHGDWSCHVFCSHINPIYTRGADYAHPILMSPPSFESQGAPANRPSNYFKGIT